MGLSKTAKIMMLSVIPVCLVLMAAGLTAIFLFERVSELESGPQFALGVVLGGVCTAVKIALLEKSLNRAADAEQANQAKNVGRVAFLGRYLITIAVLVIAAFVPFLGIFGAAAGIMSLRFAAYITVAVENRAENKSNKKNKSKN